LLKEVDSGHTKYNASVQLATDLGETIKRIDGTEAPLVVPWGDQGGRPVATDPKPTAAANTPAAPEAGRDTDEVPPTQTQIDESAGNRAIRPSAALAGETELPSREGSRTRRGGTTVDMPAKADAPPEAGKKPQTLEAARDGAPDDLKMIKGIGPKLEQLLNSMGFFHFDQIAAWTGAEIAWVDENLEGFKGRVSRDSWVAQAKKLAGGEETEFSQRAKDEGTYED